MVAVVGDGIPILHAGLDEASAFGKLAPFAVDLNIDHGGTVRAHKFRKILVIMDGFGQGEKIKGPKRRQPWLGLILRARGKAIVGDLLEPACHLWDGLAETSQGRATEFDRLLQTLEKKSSSAGGANLNGIDPTDVDHYRPIESDKGRIGERALVDAEGLANKHWYLAGKADPGKISFGLEEENVFKSGYDSPLRGAQTNAIALPVGRFRGVFCGCSPQPRYRLGETLWTNRLEDVINRIDFEGTYGIF